MEGIIKAVCISEKRGTVKKNINEVNVIKDFGLEGDAHAGKWHRQVSFLSADIVDEFNEKGASVIEGDFGENILAYGIDFKKLPVGTKLICNDAKFEITQIGKECHSHCEIYKRVGDCIMPREGIFAKVLESGTIKVGDKIEVIYPEKDMPYMAAVMTLSDKGSRGERVDTSGPRAAEILKEHGFKIVEMPDGTLRVYARSTGSKIAEAVSLDGGKTWTEAAYVPGMTQPGWGSQLSVIRYGGLIEGKPALIMSTPAGVGNYRRDGRVKIGLITDTGKEGSEKYKIDWTYDYSVDSKNAGFAYSCLSELPNHQIGLMYEKYDSYNPAELHSQDIMKYEELSLSELMGKEVVEIIPQTEGKGTVSQRNTVKKGSKITIEAYPEEGYQFVRWEDEKGNPVSEQEKYTFDAKESAAFTAVFEQEKEEVDKSHLKEAIRHAEEQMQDEKYQDVIPVVREEYEEAYKNAKAIDEKPDATSEEVETAYKTLIEVGKRLTMYKGDLTELQAAYDLYAGKDLSIYTQDSKTVLEEALKEAEKVLKLGENAVKEDVNEALEKLQKAIEGLEKSEPNPPTDPEFPTDPDSGNTDIVNPDNSLSPDDTPSTNGTPSASDEKAVATGDKETPVGWTTLGFAAMLAAAGRFLGRKKRR